MDLQHYFMEETNKKLDDLKEDMKAVYKELHKLNEFKVRMRAESKTHAAWTSTIISVVIGILTLLASIIFQ